jgi:hypothetical protein
MAGYIGSKAVKLSTTAANVTGNITVGGNVDGRDVSVDGTKLDTIPVISTSSTASFIAISDGTTDGYIQLNCSANSHGIKLKSPPHSAGASYTLVFPVNDGDAGQVLKTDGSGVLAWVTTSSTDNTKLPLAGGAMTGAITTNSTFDGVDIATRDAILTSTTTTASAALPKSGGALTGNVTFGDSNKAIFGAGSDLQIYHDGTNSYISDQGTNDLKILATDFQLKNAADNEFMMTGVTDGAVTLYHNNAAKIATSSGGVAVTGDVAITSGGTLDIFNSGNASTTLTALFGADNGAGNGRTNNTNKTTVLGMPHYTNAEEPAALIVAGSLSSSTFVTIGGGASVANAATYVSFNTAANPTTTGGTERMRINSSGHVMIGTTTEGQNQADNFTVSDAGNMGMTLRSTNSGECSIFFSDATSGAGEYAGWVQYLHSADSMDFGTNGAERMRIDSSGNLLVGTTDNSLYNNTTGGGFKAGGDDRTDMARQADVVATMNRTGNSDGDIVQFRRNGTTAGSIGVAGTGTELFIAGSGANTSGIYFNGANQTLPMKAGSLSNATQDLGKSNFKWKDLYLSGGVFLGSHYEANRLHTYEEGDFQLSVAGRSGGAFGNGKYTKIGRTVTWQWYSAGQFTVTTATASFSGLPFGAIGGSYYSGFIAYHNTYTTGSKGGYIGGGSTSGYFTDNNTGSVAASTGAGKYLMIAGTYLTL